MVQGAPPGTRDACPGPTSFTQTRPASWTIDNSLVDVRFAMAGGGVISLDSQRSVPLGSRSGKTIQVRREHVRRIHRILALITRVSRQRPGRRAPLQFGQGLTGHDIHMPRLEVSTRRSTCRRSQHSFEYLLGYRLIAERPHSPTTVHGFIHIHVFSPSPTMTTRPTASTGSSPSPPRVRPWPAVPAARTRQPRLGMSVGADLRARGGGDRRSWYTCPLHLTSSSRRPAIRRRSRRLGRSARRTHSRWSPLPVRQSRSAEQPMTPGP